MIMRELIGDVFDYYPIYPLAHCISADYALAGGIAREIDQRFGVRKELQKIGKSKCPDVILTKGIYNLVTKKGVGDIPEYHDVWTTLRMLRHKMEGNTNKIAMPRIGCGIDGLSWPIVKNIIGDIFYDMDIEIIVCQRKAGR